jgi:hypothetical protein
VLIQIVAAGIKMNLLKACDVSSGRSLAQIDAIYPLARVGYAHRHIERSTYIGNIMPSVRDA